MWKTCEIFNKSEKNTKCPKNTKKDTKKKRKNSEKKNEKNTKKMQTHKTNKKSTTLICTIFSYISKLRKKCEINITFFIFLKNAQQIWFKFHVFMFVAVSVDLSAQYSL